MTGLDLIKSYNQNDLEWSMNQFIDDFKADTHAFYEKISLEPNLIEITKEETIQVTVLVALTDYLLQINNLFVPSWVRSKLFQLEEPLFVSRSYDDADHIRLLYQTPAPFRARNIFVKREGMDRI